MRDFEHTLDESYTSKLKYAVRQSYACTDTLRLPKIDNREELEWEDIDPDDPLEQIPWEYLGGS